jgi:hypothetical protein
MRPEPMPAAGGKVYRLYPVGHDGFAGKAPDLGALESGQPPPIYGPRPPPTRAAAP